MGLGGIEPPLTDSKSVVLPLDYRARSIKRYDETEIKRFVSKAVLSER